MKKLYIKDNLPKEHNLSELTGVLRELDKDIVATYHGAMQIKRRGVTIEEPAAFTVIVKKSISLARIKKIITEHVPTETEKEASARVGKEALSGKVGETEVVKDILKRLEVLEKGLKNGQK